MSSVEGELGGRIEPGKPSSLKDGWNTFENVRKHIQHNRAFKSIWKTFRFHQTPIHFWNVCVVLEISSFRVVFKLLAPARSLLATRSALSDGLERDQRLLHFQQSPPEIFLVVCVLTDSFLLLSSLIICAELFSLIPRASTSCWQHNIKSLVNFSGEISISQCLNRNLKSIPWVFLEFQVWCKYSKFDKKSRKTKL